MVLIVFNICVVSIMFVQINNNFSDLDNDLLQFSLDNSGFFVVGGLYMVELIVSDGSLSVKCIVIVIVNDNQKFIISCFGM